MVFPLSFPSRGELLGEGREWHRLYCAESGLDGTTFPVGEQAWKSPRRSSPPAFPGGCDLLIARRSTGSHVMPVTVHVCDSRSRVCDRRRFPEILTRQVDDGLLDLPYAHHVEPQAAWTVGMAGAAALMALSGIPRGLPVAKLHQARRLTLKPSLAWPDCPKLGACTNCMARRCRVPWVLPEP